MRQRSLLPSSLAALLLAACVESGPPGAKPPTVTNVGLVTQPSELAGDGDLWLVAAREFEAGGRDLDQDGDALDQVVFVVDLARGTSRNSSLALSKAGASLPLAVGGRIAAFAASEGSGGGRDLNGDGDALDDVLFVHDGASGTTRGLGLALAAGAQPEVGDGLVAFAVGEAAQGDGDLNGDLDQDDDVLHVFDRATGETTNTRLPVSSRLFLGGGRVAHLEPESADENGDGDALDLVLHVFDPATGEDLSSGLASDGLAPLEADGVWLLAVPEVAQGGADLSGDGDALDAVLHVFDPRTDFARNLGLVCPGPGCAVASRPAGARETFAFLARESEGVGAPSGDSAGPGAAPSDLNDDGDFLDDVAFTYDPRTDKLSNTRRAAVLPLVFVGSSLGFRALESGQQLDLDEDGDLLDAVAFVFDPFAAKATNLRQDAIDLRGSEDFLLLARPEGTSGVDSNLDGDKNDVIVHAFDRRSGLTTDTKIASVDAFGATASEILLYVSESSERRDLNADRDLSDEVFVLFDVPSKTSLSLNLAGGADEARFASFSPSGKLVLLGNERSQGSDLDGDGDLSDQVFHRGE
jgi:hypothetical protein